MDISILTLKLIILLIPGAIAYIIYQKLTICDKRKEISQFIINSVLFGAFIYVLNGFLLGNICRLEGFVDFWSQLSSSIIPYNIVGISSLSAVATGFLAAQLDNRKVINRIGQHLGISNKYGDENLFSYFLNQNSIQEVNIHDIPNNLTYNGLVRHYSETDEMKEIVLGDVRVFAYDDPTAGPSYFIKMLYIVKPKDNLIIEIPEIPENTFKNEQKSNIKQAS